MTPASRASQLSVDLLGEIKAHPAFRTTARRAASESVRLFRELDPAYQWITKDIGRAAICVTALTLSLLGRLTVQSLTAACVNSGISSAGRVQQVVRRCQEVGAMQVEDGAGLWTRRPVRLGGAFMRTLRERALVDFHATLTLAPELAPLADVVSTDEGFVSLSLALSTIVSLRNDLLRFGVPPMDFFLQREAGMSILFDFIDAQPPGGEQFVADAPISRYALSRRYGVSRAHINKLLAETGEIECVGSDRVVFSRRLSEALERHFAVVFVLNRAAGEVLASGWRLEPSRQAAEA